MSAAYDEMFAPFPGSDAEMFIQWKGTDVCIDFLCPCGGEGHFDGDFAYFIRCPSCRAVYRMGTQVRAKRIDPADIPNGAKPVELDREERA